MDKAIVVRNNELIIKGEVMFSTLRDPKPFVDKETGKAADRAYYKVDLKIGKEHAQEVMAALDALNDKAYETETQGLSTVDKKKIKKADEKYQDIADSAGEPTGEIKVSIKRLDKMGDPAIRDKDSNLVDRKFIPSGSVVMVRAGVRSYKAFSKAGISLSLVDVRILEEAENVFKVKTDPELDKLMGAVDLDDLPF